MKKIYILFLASVAIFSSSCNFLDVEPKTEWSPGDFPTEDAHIQGLLDGGYERLDNALLQGFVNYGDERADVYYINDRTQTTHAYINRNLLDGNNSRASWLSFYEVIKQSNVVLANIDSFIAKPDNGTTALYNYYNIKSQAYAMRAYAYFWIVRIWGEAPIMNEVADNAQKDYSRPKSSTKDIFAQIHSDLDSSLSVYGLMTNTTINGRKNMDAWRNRFNAVSARAIKAECYMWQAKYENESYYDDALALLTDTKLIDETKYSLTSLYSADQVANAAVTDTKTTKIRTYVNATPFSKMFNSGTGSTGAESVFELAFSAADGDVNNAFNTFWASTSITTLKAREELYYELFKDKYKAEEGRAETDPDLVDFRLYASVSAPSTDAPAKFNACKWVINYSKGDSRNIVLVRLADLLLLRAEARIRPLSSNTVSASDAILILSDINKVRVRAMGPDAAIQPAMVTSWTKADWNTLIKNERQRELLFEGQRWFDLMRWGDALDVLANMKPSAATFPYETGPIVYSKNPDALYWPVSNDEIRRGSIITQNSYYR